MAFVTFPRDERSRAGVSGPRLGVEILEDRVVPAANPTLVSQALKPPTDPGLVINGADGPVEILGTDEFGRYILVQSTATNLVDRQVTAPGQTNLYRYDVQVKRFELVSVYAPDPVGNDPFVNFSKGLGVTRSIPGQSLNAVISEDGQSVAFLSAGNAYQFDRTLGGGLAADGGGDDLFVWRAPTGTALNGTVTLASRTFQSQALGQFGQVSNPAISSDGSTVTFVSTADIDTIIQQTQIFPTVSQNILSLNSIYGQFIGPVLSSPFFPFFTIPAGTIDLQNPTDFAFRESFSTATGKTETGTPDLFRATVGQTPEPVSFHKQPINFVSSIGVLLVANFLTNQTTHFRYVMDGNVEVDPLNRYSTIGQAGFVTIDDTTNDVVRYNFNTAAGDVALAKTGGAGIDTQLVSDPRTVALNTVTGVAPGAAGLGVADNAIISRINGDVLVTYKANKAAGAVVPGFVSNNGGDFELYRIRTTAGGIGGQLVELMTASAGTRNVGAAGTLPLNALGNPDPRGYQITPDGSKLVFTSSAPDLAENLVDQNATFDVFQRDGTGTNVANTKVTVAISVQDANRLATGNKASRYPTMTTDGLVVAFESDANNLTPQVDANNAPDVFVNDLVLLDTLLGSTDKTGTVTGNGGSFGPVAISRVIPVTTDFFRNFQVFFGSSATDLDPNVTVDPTAVRFPGDKTTTPQIYIQSFPVFISDLVRTFAYSGGNNGFVATATLDSRGQVVTTSKFQPFRGFTGDLRVASADLNGDGVLDVVVGAGPGGGPRVALVDGFNGRVINDFFAFEPTFTGGVYVGVIDRDNDGRSEVIVGAGEGGGPRFQIYDSTGTFLQMDKFAYETSARTGVRVASGDVNGDNVADVVVAAGVGGGPRVQAFDGKQLPNLVQLANFFAYEVEQRGGAYVSAGDFDGDGIADIVVGGGPEGGPRVRVFNSENVRGFDPTQQQVFADFFAFDSSSRDGVRVLLRDINGDKTADIVTATGGGFPRIRTFLGGNTGGKTVPVQQSEIVPFDSTFGLFGAWVG